MKMTALSITTLLALAGLTHAADPVVGKEILGKDKATVKGGTLLFLGANATDGVSLRVLVKDSYDSEPAAGREKNDLSVIAGLGVRL